MIMSRMLTKSFAHKEVKTMADTYPKVKWFKIGENKYLDFTELGYFEDMSDAKKYIKEEKKGIYGAGLLHRITEGKYLGKDVYNIYGSRDDKRPVNKEEMERYKRSRREDLERASKIIIS